MPLDRCSKTYAIGVKYLLSCSNNHPTLKESSRFKNGCFPIQEKYQGVDVSALEFALKMKEKEIGMGLVR